MIELTIKFETNEGEEITLNEEEARNLYNELGRIFEEKS